MKITIIQEDGVVGVDGEFRKVDLSELDSSIHAVQFDTVSGVGHIEFDAGLVPRKPNQGLGKTAFRPYERFIKAWKSAGLVPERTPDEIKRDAREKLEAETRAELITIDLVSIRAMREYITSKPDAPKILKDSEAAAISARAKLAAPLKK